jgi:hypothetical protein
MIREPQNRLFLSLLLFLLLILPAQLCFCEDGTYDAQVTTESGTYTVPVEVENGEASGINSRGDSVEIEINDSSYENE